MSESGVQHLEAGRRSPRPQTVTRLANALKIPADKLRADLANNPAAEEQLAELTQQVEVLAERIKQVTATLPDQRAKTEQGAA
jgi:transcriptional regulator with XRE-family HTH domain